MTLQNICKHTKNAVAPKKLHPCCITVCYYGLNIITLVFTLSHDEFLVQPCVYMLYTPWYFCLIYIVD